MRIVQVVPDTLDADAAATLALVARRADAVERVVVPRGGGTARVAGNVARAVARLGGSRGAVVHAVGHRAARAAALPRLAAVVMTRDALVAERGVEIGGVTRVELFPPFEAGADARRSPDPAWRTIYVPGALASFEDARLALLIAGVLQFRDARYRVAFEARGPAAARIERFAREGRLDSAVVWAPAGAWRDALPASADVALALSGRERLPLAALAARGVPTVAAEGVAPWLGGIARVEGRGAKVLAEAVLRVVERGEDARARADLARFAPEVVGRTWARALAWASGE